LILLDTSGLLAALDQDSRMHDGARAVLTEQADATALSPFVLAELDYLVSARLGTSAELQLLDEVARGIYWLTPFTADDVAAARAIIDQHRDLGIGLTDASLVVLSEKLGTEQILTLDERDFRALRTPRGKPFQLLPMDA
jgi:hypothetical protein